MLHFGERIVETFTSSIISWNCRTLLSNWCVHLYLDLLDLKTFNCKAYQLPSVLTMTKSSKIFDARKSLWIERFLKKPTSFSMNPLAARCFTQQQQQQQQPDSVATAAATPATHHLLPPPAHTDSCQLTPRSKRKPYMYRVTAPKKIKRKNNKREVFSCFTFRHTNRKGTSHSFLWWHILQVLCSATLFLNSPLFSLFWKLAGSWRWWSKSCMCETYYFHCPTLISYYCCSNRTCPIWNTVHPADSTMKKV